MPGRPDGSKNLKNMVFLEVTLYYLLHHHRLMDGLTDLLNMPTSAVHFT